ncbi:hypothetical protein AMELA_G00104190 [Ameiurus melas]|uniref:Uncharacterized protein n=1 Tax=Ameiurus melas TaxID=219545 RepID=A0A7J6AUE9_AMEME|nr:hypothetical protein AMELA_G00104190 [Ameiurus melas]
MNILIIFVLIFTFTLKAKGTNNTTATTNVIDHSSGNFTNQDGTMTSNLIFASTTKMHMADTTTTSCNDKMLDMKTVFIFILGVFSSTVIFSTVLCFVSICSRCRKTDANTDKEGTTLVSVKSGHDQLMMKSDEDQADEQAPLQVQSPVEVSTNTSEINNGTKEEMTISGTEQTEGAGEVNEVDYASINYSLLQKKDNEGLKPQKVESDYAEIQLKKMSEGEEVETLQDGEKQGGEKQDDVKKHEVQQDGLNRCLDGGTESHKHVELQEVQV